MDSGYSFLIAEFLELPGQEPPLEFADGIVSQKVAPRGRQSVLQGALYERLNWTVRPNRLVMFFPELRATFGGHSYVPDLAVYRRERIPRTATGQVADDFFAPPDIAVEITSPGQSVNALVRRCLWYVDHGLQAALLVDPEDESVLLFRPAARPSVLRGSDTLALADILPGIDLGIADLFAVLNVEDS